MGRVAVETERVEHSTRTAPEQLVAGTERTAVVDQYLEAADVILLLISPDFLALQSQSGRELKQALERHEAGQVLVVPPLLRPVDWQGASFAHLSLLPKSGRAITRWKNRDEGFAQVVAGLRQMEQIATVLEQNESN